VTKCSVVLFFPRVESLPPMPHLSLVSSLVVSLRSGLQTLGKNSTTDGQLHFL